MITYKIERNIDGKLIEITLTPDEINSIYLKCARQEKIEFARAIIENYECSFNAAIYKNLMKNEDALVNIAEAITEDSMSDNSDAETEVLFGYGYKEEC